MELINVVEKMVWDKMDEVLEKKPGVCKCDKCRADIAAYALNKLTPRYAVSEKGKVLSKAALLETEIYLSVIIALTEGVEVVNANPRHEKELSR